MNLNEIKNIIKQNILIDRLELEDITADEITDDEEIFSEDGVGLDSVEALDLMAGVEKEFKVKIPKMNPDETEKNFATVNALADYVNSLLND